MSMRVWTVVYTLQGYIMHGYIVAGNKQAALRRAKQQYENIRKVH